MHHKELLWLSVVLHLHHGRLKMLQCSYLVSEPVTSVYDYEHLFRSESNTDNITAGIVSNPLLTSVSPFSQSP